MPPTTATVRTTCDACEITGVTKCNAGCYKPILFKIVVSIVLLPAGKIQLSFALDVVVFFNSTSCASCWPLPCKKILLYRLQKGTAAIIVYGVFTDVEFLIVGFSKKLTARRDVAHGADINIGPRRKTKRHCVYSSTCTNKSQKNRDRSPCCKARGGANQSPGKPQSLNHQNYECQ